jgi:hypothetical protein
MYLFLSSWLHIPSDTAEIDIDLRPNSWTKSRRKLSSLNSQQLCLENSISSNSRNLLPFSTVKLLFTVKKKGGKADRKPHLLPHGLRNLYSNLKSENFQDYAQKPQLNCTVHEFCFWIDRHACCAGVPHLRGWGGQLPPSGRGLRGGQLLVVFLTILLLNPICLGNNMFQKSSY